MPHWMTISILLFVMTLLLSLSLSPPAAYAGQASTGELLFYPCTSCHPVTLGSDGKPSRPLPNGFEGHRIVLTSHDRLGKGDAACLVCHDDASKNPGKLKLIDGTLIDIKDGDISAVCYRCHSAKYQEWKDGTHGRHQPKCTAAGCHDPHTPSWIYVAPLRPFTGSGFQARAVSKRVAFSPLASPPSPPPVETPWWLRFLDTIGVLTVVGIAGVLILGRQQR
ncbi:MAG: hypothetical protein CVT67_05700 [Actinobacteria bacterium HGW-Actinobacteria-7]|nr:MAG: hypothetical protein CVT67_05700 [Actinobacteria bacterium HGW-Actinobacteria-7]